MAKRILSTLMCVLLVLSTVVVASAQDTSKEAAGVNTKYTTASQALDSEYGYNGDDLGATYSPEATTFKVWAPTATSIRLNLYATGSDSETGAQKLGEYDLEKLMDGDNWTGIWTCVLSGDHKNEYYTYTITAKNVTGEKTVTNETNDIYSKAVGVNGKRSMIVDLNDTNPDGWDKDAHVLFDSACDSYVWEVHVKDFSYDTKSGVSDANRGKYLAFTETGTTLNGEGNVSTCIDYLKKLGVTTVQINPFYDFGSINEAGDDTQFNWGYDPMNYNVPEGSYSSNPYDGNVRIRECKAMVKALHDAGISVVMDVVYNHTYNTETTFQKTVPDYYYRMKADGSFSNGSGCGNETASERLMFRNFMIQSCLYWVNEYHIDGFRFDLMALHDVESLNQLRAELDKVDSRITVWGEGWTGGSSEFPTTTCTGETFKSASQSAAASLDNRIGFFSDEVRDLLKGSVFQMTAMGWLQGAGSSAKKLIPQFRANPSNFNAGLPSKVVQYTSCHDNQTLWDRLANSQGVTKDFRKRNAKFAAQSKLSAAVLNLSLGVTFTLAGEEMGRSKDNDHNSYKSPADLNMIDWSLAASNADIVSYYAGMREIRSHFSPLTANNRDAKFEGGYVNETTNASGALLSSEGVKVMWTNETPGEWNKLLLITNNKKNGQPLEYQLDSDIKDWVVIADSQQAGVKKLYEVNDNTFTVDGFSAVVAVDKASFEAAAVQNTKGSVKVSCINSVTGKTIDSYTFTGAYGDSYAVADPNTIGVEYVRSDVEGDVVGTFTEADKEVKIKYDYFVPESIKTDIDGNGKLNINDATMIQLYKANRAQFTEEQVKKADVTGDGKVTVDDVTMIQMHLAQMSVGMGTVTVNYYKTGTTEKIAESVVYKDRVGQKYTPDAANALGYALNTAELPESETTVPFGNRDVNFYYDFVSSNVDLHVKHSSGSGFDPTFWLWGQKNGLDSGTNYCKNKSWPGDTVTEADGNGWFNKSFEVASSDTAYNIIIAEASSSGTDALAQSADCKGFIQNELWIVIDDAQSSIILKIYDVNPDENPSAEPFFVG